jgi:hypothetical protein
MAFFAKPAANKVLGIVKNYLIEELQKKINQGNDSIDELFDDIEAQLKNNNIFQNTLVGICIIPKGQAALKDYLKESIHNIELTEGINERDEISEDVKKKLIDSSDELKKKLESLIEKVITCDNLPANSNPAVSAGGSKQRDRKQKRRQKTKKRINKKSRGHKRHSRK